MSSQGLLGELDEWYGDWVDNTRRFNISVLNMPRQLLFRALRCAAIALLLAAGIDVCRQVFFPNLPAWQLHTTAILLGPSIVFLLTFRLSCQEQVRSSLSTGGTNLVQHIVGSLSKGLSDVTERKATEDKLLRLASIVECSQDAIIGKTTEGVNYQLEPSGGTDVWLHEQ